MMEVYINEKKLVKKHRRKIFIIILTLFIMIFIAFYSIKVGTMTFSLMDIFEGIFKKSNENINVHIIKNIRIPRILTGILAGMNLAVAGVLLQGILKNPMASPNIIGVNSGAGLLAIIMMIFFPLETELFSISAFLVITVPQSIPINAAAVTIQISITVNSIFFNFF